MVGTNNAVTNVFTLTSTTQAFLEQNAVSIGPAATTENALHIYQGYDDGTTISVSIDEGTPATHAHTSSPALTGIAIGGTGAAIAGDSLDGWMCEFYMSLTPSATDRSTIHYNQRFAYATP